MILEINDAVCGYGRKAIIKNVSLKVQSGEILCLLGPNGVGKTTLFKTLLGFLKLQHGRLLLDGKDVIHWSRKKIARIMGYVPQAHTPPFPFTVMDVVVMGRAAHLSTFASPSKKDLETAAEALDRLGIGYLKNNIYTEISGGERQLVLIARALTQQPEILIMDEPTSNLDFGNQIRVLEQISKVSNGGMAVIMTSHFPDHAFLCSAKVALMQKSGSLKVGTASEVITEENMKMAYGINVKIISLIDSKGNEIRTCIPLLS